MLKKLGKVYKIVLNIFIVLAIFVVIIFIYNYIQLKVMNKKYVNLFGYTFFQVATGSMSGAIEINDIILVKVTDDFSKDDIISFESDGEIITHRLIQVDDDKLLTKGDANNTEDEPISKTDVIGKVVSIYSGLGVWIKVFSDTKVLISIFMTLLFFGFILSFEKK